jgi:hypothetical protein
MRHSPGLESSLSISFSSVYLSIAFETSCPVGGKPSVEIKHLRTCDDRSKRPIEGAVSFVAEIPAGAETKNWEAHQSPSAKNRKIGSDCSFHASESFENCSFSHRAGTRTTSPLISFRCCPVCSLARCPSSSAFKALSFSARLRSSQQESRLLA